jgi:hypothetical protein
MTLITLVGSGDIADPSLFRILVSSDIHLGYGEKNPERGDDSFNSFDELLGIGVTWSRGWIWSSWGETSSMRTSLAGGRNYNICFVCLRDFLLRSAEIKCL